MADIDANEALERIAHEGARYMQRAVVAELMLEDAQKEVMDLQKQIADMRNEKNDVMGGDDPQD